MNFQKPREIAFRVLQHRETIAKYTEELLDREFATTNISQADRALAQELVYGVVRWQSTLDCLIERKVQTSLPKIGSRILLRLGLYQLFWLDRIPDHAAVHETVELGKKSGLGAQAGFLNAVLRAYAREKSVTQPLLIQLKSENPAIGFSHPDWLVQRWVARWGRESAIALLEWNNRPPKVFARVNTLLTDPGTLLSAWRERDQVEYDFVRRDWVPENLVFELKHSPPLARLASFQQGWFYVQDPSTLLAVTELDPKPGETILDLCAAPGGKASLIAQQMENKGRLVARDIYEDRLTLLRDNFRRLGVTCADIALLAANSPPVETPSRTFDRILIDAPCSNTGVIRRRVDLRWRIHPSEFPRLQATQRGLLDRAARELKPGGTIVYSTCSLEPEENEQIVAGFLAANPQFHLVRERRLLPFQDEVDGAYVATLSLSG